MPCLPFFWEVFLSFFLERKGSSRVWCCLPFLLVFEPPKESAPGASLICLICGAGGVDFGIYLNSFYRRLSDVMSINRCR